MNLLLEIGTEELPAGEIRSAVNALAEAMVRQVAESGLGGGTPILYSTPRRLAVAVPNVLDRQPDRSREVRGPSRARAFGDDGKPTQALAGFCRGQGVSESDLEVRETDAGVYVFAIRREVGQPAQMVLPDLLASCIRNLAFHRSMRWGNGEEKFSRPIAWLVALFGREVLPVEVAGITAGRESRGHRFLSPGPVPLGGPEDYGPRLRDARVIADRAERRRLVESQVRAKAADADLEPELTDDLLDEVTDLIEFPTAFLGQLPSQATSLPQAVLRSVLVGQQRLFPLRRADGALGSAFVGVRNGDVRALDTVVRGNERVARARLEDALFFYRRDLERPLAERMPSLERMEVGEGLGTMADRARRIVQVVSRLTAPEDGEVRTAASLLLADLATEMVYEYPELAGTMGEVYAEKQGVPAEVARLIGEARKPHTASDEPPEAPGAALLGAALRACELVGAFSVGRAPSGSEDPYGSRRTALGLLRLYQAHSSLPPVERLIEETCTAFAFAPERHQALTEELVEFLAARLTSLLVEDGVPANIAQAVTAVRPMKLASARDRAHALEGFLRRPEAQTLLTAYRRAAHLASEASGAGKPVSPPTEDEERRLHEALVEMAGRREEALENGDFTAHLKLVAGLAPALDRFLTQVLVMDPDPTVRSRRLGLLHWAVALMAGTAELGMIGRGEGSGPAAA